MHPPRSTAGADTDPSMGQTADVSATLSSIGVWYVAVTVTLLLVVAGIYIVYLHQERLEWRDAATQTSIGQEFLRVDRDEILQKIQVREAELSSLEQQLSERDARIASLESERDRLKDEASTLNQDLAIKDQALLESPETDGDHLELPMAENGIDRDNQDHAGDEVQVVEQLQEIKRLEMSLVETGELLVQYQSDLRNQKALATETRLDKVALQQEVTRLRNEIAATQQSFRRGRVIYGHHAGLSETKPEQTEVGPEYWQLIEDWLKEKLQRAMPIPDLSAIGWSYEGARLLASAGGPSMVMLIYADPDGSPISLTIAQDPSGAAAPASQRQAGLNLIEWQDHSHAFVLAGEAEKVILRVVASALLDQITEITAESAVPSSRFFRPELRPDLSEQQSSG